MNRAFLLLIFALIFLLLDVYAFQAVKTATQNTSSTWRTTTFVLYWSFTGLSIIALGWALLGNGAGRTIISTVLFTSIIAKLFVSVFLLSDDLRRLALWVIAQFQPATPPEPTVATGNPISRSEFLSKAGLIAGAVPLAAVGWGILKGAHDYKIHHKRVAIKGLPKQLEGIRIAQLSDIHSGSFWDEKAVSDGIDQLLGEKPDLVLFTGDLVNNVAGEMKDFMGIFGRVKAPLGVFSVLGNHDYGDYAQWESPAAKAQNLQDLVRVHGNLGWDLMRNENRILTVDGAKLALVGVENWSSSSRFPKYGDMEKAFTQEAQDTDTKILLSHDPSHWRAKILEQHPYIALTLSGHTHGFQFGIDTEVFKWSPAQYMYPEWADLYTEKDQHLYVNRGFGYLGFPGRVGIRPEITILELVRA